MQKSDTYLIEWYGPFFSKEELKKWEDTRSDKFNLYVFQAKQTGKSDKYYCGMTVRQTVGMKKTGETVTVKRSRLLQF